MDLDKIAPIIVDNFKKALEEKRYKFGNPPRGTRLGNKIASGNLQSSISAKTNLKKGTIEILMEPYGRYVQSGRSRGKTGVPIDAILTWMRERGIRSNDLSDRQLAFAIQTNIKKFGIKPSNWFDVAIDNMFEDADLSDALLTEVESDINEQFDKLIDLLEGI